MNVESDISFRLEKIQKLLAEIAKTLENCEYERRKHDRRSGLRKTNSRRKNFKLATAINKLIEWKHRVEDMDIIEIDE